MARNVYISSTYRDLKDHRKKVIDFFSKKTLKDNFILVSMEGYVADDTEPSAECVNDVAACDIYILILANRYGFIKNDPAINPARLSVTELEYNAAIANNKSVLAFFADTASNLEYDTGSETEVEEKKKKLAAFKQKVQNSKMMHPEGFTNPHHLALQVAESLISRFSLEAQIQSRIDYNKIYWCDREQQDNFFDKKRRDIKEPLQFYLIKCHENDMPHFFIERKKLDFEEREIKTIDLLVRPAVLEEDTDYESVEFAIKKAILKVWNKMPVFAKHKFRDEDDVTPQKAIKVLEELQEYEYLLIAWNIQSLYWKNNKLQEHISMFYKKCCDLNSSIKTTKKIFFFGMLTYTPGSSLSREEFDQCISNIEYGNVFPAFPLIKTEDIRQWLIQNEIEDNPADQKTIIISSVPDKNRDAYFMSELEKPLRNILEKVYLQS